MNMPSRRKVLNIAGRSLLTAGAAGALGRLSMMNAYAAPASGYRALVCVFLFGGNDANNMVVPIATTKNMYTDYSTARQAVALPQGSLLPVSAGSDTYGFHPAMTGLHNIYGSGKMAVLANVGVLAQPLTVTQYKNKAGVVIPVNLFSHADQQGQWQTDDPSGFGTTGWAGRVADLVGPAFNTTPAGSTLPFPAAISISGNNMLEVGGSSSPAIVTSAGPSTLTNFPTTPNARTQAFMNLLSFDNGVQLVQSANGITQAGVNDASVCNLALASSTYNPTTFPNTSLGGQLKMVARIINVHQKLGANRQIFFVSMGGFDNHDKLLTDQSTNLGQVSDAVATFYNEMKNTLMLDQDVTVFTESDFSRTNQPNTSNGSDHAWGSHHMIVGGAVQGGVWGTFPDVKIQGADDVTGRGVFLPTTSLDQYGATLARWIGVADGDLPNVFSNLKKFETTARPLGTLGFMG